MVGISYRPTVRPLRDSIVLPSRYLTGSAAKSATGTHLIGKSVDVKEGMTCQFLLARFGFSTTSCQKGSQRRQFRFTKGGCE